MMKKILKIISQNVHDNYFIYLLGVYIHCTGKHASVHRWRPEGDFREPSFPAYLGPGVFRLGGKDFPPSHQLPRNRGLRGTHIRDASLSSPSSQQGLGDTLCSQ